MATTLEEFKVNIRLRLSALWTTIMFCYIYGDYFELYVPQKAASLLNGQNNLNSPLKLLMATIVLTLPALMIVLSLVLKPKTAQRLNVGVAIFFTFFTLYVGIISMSDWRTFYVFLSFLESILTATVVIMGLKWPKFQV